MDKRKVGGDSCYPHKCDQNAKHQVNSATVSQGLRSTTTSIGNGRSLRPTITSIGIRRNLWRLLLHKVMEGINDDYYFYFEKWFKDVFVDCVLENVLKKMFCNGSRLYKNVYKTFCLLKVF